MSRFSCTSQSLALGAALTMTSTAIAADQHAFRTDSGVYELGYTVLAPEAFIGNYYQTPGSDEFLLDTVDVALGFGLEGLPFEVIIYEDADDDGDPSNASIVSRTPAAVAPNAPLFNVLNVQSVAIEPTLVTGGFFVGVWIKEQPFEGLVGVNLSDYQTAPSAFRTGHWAAGTNWVLRPGLPAMGGGNAPLNVVDLDQNLQIVESQLNWVIRASGSSTAFQFSPDMNGDNAHDMMDVLAFLTMFQTGDADYNDDGLTDIEDVLTFIVEWQAAG